MLHGPETQERFAHFMPRNDRLHVISDTCNGAGNHVTNYAKGALFRRKYVMWVGEYMLLKPLRFSSG